MRLKLLVGWQCSESEAFSYWSQIVEIPVLPVVFELKDFWHLHVKDASLHYLLPQNIYEMAWDDFDKIGLTVEESDEIMRELGFARDFLGDSDEAE